jgi:PPOX class probable F420-dependent enzyme
MSVAEGANVTLSNEVIALLRQPSLCFLATTMPDDSPQVTEVWVDTDGEHVVIDSVQGHVKVRNIERDPRVSVAIADSSEPRRYFQVRGRVIDITPEGAAEHIEMLSRKYTGQPYAWYGGRDQVRLLLTIEATSVSGIG